VTVLYKSGRPNTCLTPDCPDFSVIDVVRHYRSLERVERRFRVLKDFLGLRPIRHFTEKRVRGHISLCVLAAVIEAVMTLTSRPSGSWIPI